MKKYFVTSDTKSAAAIKTISDINSVTFFHLDIHTPPNLQFGTLF